MSRKKVAFNTRVFKAYTKKDDSTGEEKMHVVAIASDSKPDCENDRMSERCIDGFVEQCNRGVDILDNHRSTFPIGVTSEAWKEEEADKVNLVIDIELDETFPQSTRLFQDVLEGRAEWQMSIGGYLDPDAGIEYEINSEGIRVRVIHGIELDHIACTRKNQACNQRAGFLQAMIKDILGGIPEFNPAKYRKALVAIQKENGGNGKIITGLTGNADMDEHFHEFAMYVVDGEVVAGETGMSIWGFEGTEHTHTISDLMKTDTAREHTHILMMGVVELSVDNRLTVKALPEETLFGDGASYDEWATKVHNMYAKNEISDDLMYAYMKQLSARADAFKSDYDKFRRTFDVKSVEKFVDSAERRFKDVLECACSGKCSDKEVYDEVRQQCADMYEYGLYLGNIITDKSVETTDDDVKRVAKVARQIVDDINHAKKRSEVMSDTTLEDQDFFGTILRFLSDAFEKTGYYDEESASFALTEVKSPFTIKGIKFPMPNGPIGDAIMRTSVIADGITGQVSRLSDDYTVGTSKAAGGHFHKYIVRNRDGKGIALKSLGHTHSISDHRFMEEVENHVHKLGGDVMSDNIIAFVSLPLADVEDNISASKEVNDYAWADGDVLKYQHHSDGKTILRGLIVSAAELLGVKDGGRVGSDDAKEVAAHLNKHFEEFDITPPEKLASIAKQGWAYCVCPDCGFTQDKEAGVPCRTIDCPECGTALMGSDSPGEVSESITLNNFAMHFETQGIEMLWFSELIEGESNMGKKIEDEVQEDVVTTDKDNNDAPTEDADKDVTKEDEAADASDGDATEGGDDAPAEGGDDAPAEGEGDAPAEGDAESDDAAPAEGDGDAPAEGDDAAEGGDAAEGDADADAGDGEAEGEGDDAEGGEEKSIFDSILKSHLKTKEDEEDASDEGGDDEEGEAEGGNAEGDAGDAEGEAGSDSDADGEGDAEEKELPPVLDGIDGFRSALQQAIALALGGQAVSPELKNLLESMDKYLTEKGLPDSSVTAEDINKAVTEKTEAVLKDVAGGFVKTLEDIAKAISVSSEQNAEVKKTLSGLSNRIADLEDGSSGSNQNKEDAGGEGGDEIDEDNVFRGMFGNPAKQAFGMRGQKQ